MFGNPHSLRFKIYLPGEDGWNLRKQPFRASFSLRSVELVERKRALRSLVPNNFPHLLYVDHEGVGEFLFQLACERDLEGIVAKHRHSRYTAEDGNPAWVKIRNRSYSQMIGRDELFERNYEAEGAPEKQARRAQRRVHGRGELLGDVCNRTLARSGAA